jgi:hypothetical protein
VGVGEVEESGLEHSQNIGWEIEVERRKYAEMERSIAE